VLPDYKFFTFTPTPLTASGVPSGEEWHG